MSGVNEWRFLDSGTESAVFHMALDSAIVTAVASGNASPVIRVFEWMVPSITIGHSQRAEEVLDPALCEKDGIPVARRPTGGRAVFHDHELAFSVIGRNTDPNFGTTPADSFGFMTDVLKETCSVLGIAVSTESAKVRGAVPEGVGKAPCFLSAARSEICWNGKKIMGIAQRRYAGVFLLQGSILTGGGQERIIDYIPGVADTLPLKTDLKARSGDLGAALGCGIDIHELKRVLFDSFAYKVGTTPVMGQPTAMEIEEARRIIPAHAVTFEAEAGDGRKHRI